MSRAQIHHLPVDRRRMLQCSTLCWVVCCAIVAHAAPDDTEQQPKQEQAFNQFFMNDENFEANVFQPSGNARQARINIEAKLKLQLNELNRICELDSSQTQKLKLAATFDIKRFFSAVDAIRQKYKASKHDQDAWNEVWQEISPLQNKLSGGLFGDDSFFHKAVRKTLTEPQLVKFDLAQQERRKYRYQSSIETVLIQFEESVPLKSAQHKALVKLVLEETKPPLVFGQHDQQVVLYQLSQVPETKLKPVFDDRQWKLAQVQINQYRGIGTYLVQNGVLPKEEKPEQVLKARIRRRLANQAGGAADIVAPAEPRPEPAP